MRVLEDIVRFLLNDKKLTRELKSIRHEFTECLKHSTSAQAVALLKERKIEKDVGKGSIKTEMLRCTVLDIFLANAQRVKESIRVLEEFFKLIDKKNAKKLKALRYKVYYLEKCSVEKLIDICNS